MSHLSYILRPKAGSIVSPLSMRYASLALRTLSRLDLMSSRGISSMSEALWSLERKRSETVVGLELFVCLSTGLRCSLKRSLSRRFVSPTYCLWQRLQCTM